MKTILLLINFLFISMIVGMAQPVPGSNAPEQLNGRGIIKGQVLDELTNESLPYTNVVLFSEKDSVMVTGCITGEDGTFIIDNSPFGRFYLEIKFIGFRRKYIPGIILSPEKSIIDLGIINIKSSSEELREVQVTAERSPVEYQIDKKVVHIEENLNAAGGSAAQALDNVPAITVDVDGNVSLRGSSNFTVLIDGKPSPLEGSDALRQIPASAVENIEIITNPSARYDPDGLSGIINIITKKRAMDGISGIVNLSAGTRDKYRGDFLLNYRNDRISAFFGADYTDETRAGTIEVSQMSVLNDTSDYVVHWGEGPFNRKGYTFKGGIGYKVNDFNSLELNGTYGYASFNRRSDEKFKEYSIPADDEKFYLQTESDTRYEDFYSMSLNHEIRFGTSGHKLTSYLYFSDEWGGSRENIDQYKTDGNWIVNDPDPYRIYIDEPGDESELRFQSDYERPFGNGAKLEAGYQLRRDSEKENYSFNEWDNAEDEWIESEDFSNALVFTRNIQAMYGMYSDKLLGIDYQLGLRGEYTFRSVQNLQSDQPSVLNRFDYFPTVHLSRKIGNQDQVQLSYSRRIRRPRGHDLDPFISYMNPVTVRIGNPDLLPEYVDSYELTYQKGLGKSFISLEGYYRLTHDAITRVTDIQDDGTRILTMENLNEEHAMGAEIMLNFLLTKWFNFNISGNVYRYELAGNITGSEVASSSTNYDSRANLNFRITPTTKLQVQAFYQGPSVTAQGRREEFLMTSAAIRQDLWHEKMSATLQIQDIFGTGSFNFNNQGPGFNDSINMRRESQVVRLTLSLRINNFKKQNGSREESLEGGAGMDQDTGGY